MRREMPVLLVVLALSGALAWGQPVSRPMLGMGDSIGAGVQSGDASLHTQVSSYLHLIAKQRGVSYRLPWVDSSATGFVDRFETRRRIFPNRVPDNLAVSGADTLDVLSDSADATTPEAIDSETDLMLFPLQGSQLDIVEAASPGLVVCWIGSNDVLGAVTSFDQLDASQMTPVSVFQDRFGELAARLGALGTPVVFGNIPDVTDIAFLLDREDLVRLTGSDFGLPEGSYTSLVEGFLLRLGLDNGTLLRLPGWVLDAGEVAEIRERVDALNAVIATEAAAIGMPVVDVNALFAEIAARPPEIGGVTLTPRFLGGLFTLDGVHPGDLAHAVVANAFILKINAAFGESIPLLRQEALLEILLTDPFVDKDGDGIVRGRPFTSALESVAVVLGVSGDVDDLEPARGSLPSLADLSPAARLDASFRALGVEPEPGARRGELLQSLGALWRHRSR